MEIPNIESIFDKIDRCSLLKLKPAEIFDDIFDSVITSTRNAINVNAKKWAKSFKVAKQYACRVEGKFHTEEYSAVKEVIMMQTNTFY